MKFTKKLAYAVVCFGLSIALLQAADNAPQPSTTKTVAQQKMELRKAVAEQLAKDVPLAKDGKAQPEKKKAAK